MAYVVAEPCIKCKYTDCVEVCPEDAFHEGANCLAIDPVKCTDCGECEPMCPSIAIYPEARLPAKWASYIELNRTYALSWPVLKKRREPLPGADAWKDREGKGGDLDPTPGAG